MWWHADFLAAEPGPGETEALPDVVQGEVSFDQVPPRLASEGDCLDEPPRSETDGGARRALRRGLRECG